MNISLDNCVKDEFHLLLRIMDRLLKNTIHSAQEWDEKEGKRNGIGPRVTAVERAVSDCRVSLKIWRKKKDDGSFSQR